MQKNRSISIGHIAAMVMMVLFLMLSFGTVRAEAVSVPQLNRTSVTMAKNDTVTLKVTNKKKGVKWYSTKKSVASVSKNGVVTAKKNGVAYVYAKVKGQTSERCRIKVRKAVLKLDKTELTMTAGSTEQLTATKKYARADVSWKSSDESIATVSEDGLVTAKEAGTVTITASVAGVKKKCVVTVEAAVEGALPDGTHIIRTQASHFGNKFDVGIDYDYYITVTATVKNSKFVSLEAESQNVTSGDEPYFQRAVAAMQKALVGQYATRDSVSNWKVENGNVDATSGATVTAGSMQSGLYNTFRKFSVGDYVDTGFTAQDALAEIKYFGLTDSKIDDGTYTIYGYASHYCNPYAGIDYDYDVKIQFTVKDGSFTELNVTSPDVTVGDKPYLEERAAEAAKKALVGQSATRDSVKAWKVEKGNVDATSGASVTCGAIQAAFLNAFAQAK